MKCSGKEMEHRFSYEFEYWRKIPEFSPIECLESKDLSESWEMEAAHVFKLKGGKFALVTESGCSCYSAGDAHIDLFPSKARAMEAFKKWEKENTPNVLEE
jgi:hypothetical protein